MISGSGLGLSLYLVSYVEMCRKNALVPHCWHLLFKGSLLLQESSPGCQLKNQVLLEKEDVWVREGHH